MPIDVMYDGESFFRHARSGIGRYFAELIAEFSADPELGVRPITPYKWIASRHLAEHDSRFVEVPLPRNIRYPVLRRLNARRLRRAEPADIVHHTFYQPEAFDLWPGRRHVTTVYDFIIERFPELLAPGDDHIARHTEVIHRADALICISDTTRADLHRFHPDYDKPVFTVPLGVGPSFFDPAPTKLPALPERYVLYVGNRTAHKNIDLLLEGYAEVAVRHPDVHLVLVGAPGPSESERIEELGIDQKTLRLRVSDAVLPWIYRKASVMMYGSLWEGFGLPVIEAMASGCPAVIEDIPALTEVGGDAALVFAPGDRATLVRHLESALTDDGEAERLRSAGLDRARLFTWRRTAELTSKVYEQIAAV
ncbi:MAG: glycosyltransferase family 4 protein [Aeromicrobium sp.]